jgi:hypothetical protein
MPSGRNCSIEARLYGRTSQGLFQKKGKDGKGRAACSVKRVKRVVKWFPAHNSGLSYAFSAVNLGMSAIRLNTALRTIKSYIRNCKY